MNASGVPSFQEPTTTFNDKNELENVRWSTGVRRHMMDVFRADPFTAMDLSATNTTLPSLGSSTAVDGLESTDGDSLRDVPMAKRKHSKSSEVVGPGKKGRKKRAHIPSPPFSRHWPARNVCVRIYCRH